MLHRNSFKTVASKRRGTQVKCILLCRPCWSSLKKSKAEAPPIHDMQDMYAIHERIRHVASRAEALRTPENNKGFLIGATTISQKRRLTSSNPAIESQATPGDVSSTSLSKAFSWSSRSRTGFEPLPLPLAELRALGLASDSRRAGVGAEEVRLAAPVGVAPLALGRPDGPEGPEGPEGLARALPAGDWVGAAEPGKRAGDCPAGTAGTDIRAGDWAGAWAGVRAGWLAGCWLMG